MATQLQIRRGTSAQVAAFTGAEGEVVVNTTNDSIHVNDGSTAGGFELARVDGSNWAITNNISTTANISFGDNDKAIFGGGSDLQIYHDGSQSVIYEGGTGPLDIRSNSETFIKNGGGTETLAHFANNGAVTLYHDNAAKLATTSTGIDVTGTVTADGLTVDGNGAFTGKITINRSGVLTRGIEWNRSGTIDAAIKLHDDEIVKFDNFFNGRYQFRSGASGSEVIRLDIASNGDIRFYNSAGTSQSLFWDSSAESLGIGTSSPDEALEVSGDIKSSGSGFGIYHFGETSDQTKIVGRDSSHASLPNTMEFFTNSVNRMVIDSSGNVGIGTSSPSEQLDVLGDIGFSGRFLPTSASSATSALAPKICVGYDYDTGFFQDTTNTIGFATSGSERMRIDSSGRVGISVTSPSSYYAKDLVVGAADEGGITIVGGTNDQNYLMFADGTSGSSLYKGYIGYDHPTDLMQMVTHGALRFYNGASSSEMGRFDASGNLLVGTTSGTGKLEVYEAGNLTEANPHFRIHGAGYSGYHFLDGTAYYIGQSSTVRALRLYSGAETAGVALTNGSTSWGTFSDERLKYDVEPVENALESLSELRTVKYRLRDVDEPDSQKKIGVVAQDLVGVLDEVIDPLQITGDDTEYMAVRYTELVPVLIKAIQEQQATITALEARITQLENN